MQTEKVNSESGDSGDALAERYISFKTKTYCHLSYCASFAHLITLKTFFLIILHVCIGIHVNYIKFERPAWPYPP